MKWYKKLGIALAGGICAVAVSTTWAVYSETVTVKNTLSTKQTAVRLREDFVQFSSFLPGEKVEKKPYFENTGDRDMILRIPAKLEGRWIGQNGNERKDLDPSMVKVNWSGSKEKDWFQAGDYLYYKNILGKSGGENNMTPPVIDSLELSKEISNDTHGLDYSGAEYELTIEAEAIPADKISAAVWEEDLKGADIPDDCQWSGLIQGE